MSFVGRAGLGSRFLDRNLDFIVNENDVRVWPLPANCIVFASLINGLPITEPVLLRNGGNAFPELSFMRFHFLASVIRSRYLKFALKNQFHRFDR